MLDNWTAARVQRSERTASCAPASLDLRPSGKAGPTSVSTAVTGGSPELAAPVLLYLVFGYTFHEVLSASPMEMDVGDDLILGWDWISSQDLPHLYVASAFGPGPL